MQDVQNMITKARELGADEHFNLSEINEIYERGKEGNRLHCWNMITDAYSFGFAKGHELAKQQG